MSVSDSAGVSTADPASAHAWLTSSGSAPRHGSPARSCAAGRPHIGVTSYRQRATSGVWDVEAAFLPTTYLNSVTNVGGVAVLLTPQAFGDELPAVAASLIARLDGLVVAGGVDVDPARYGQERRAETDRPQEMRDAWDMALMEAALAAELPMLAICRGVQVLNVLRGGSLHQHLPEVIGTSEYSPTDDAFGSASVQLEAGSRVAAAYGASTTGLVHHHQSVDRLGDGLTVTARSPEGVVEAVEVEGQPFAVGVQWHPEQDPDELQLFRELVAEARTFAAARDSALVRDSALARDSVGTTSDAVVPSETVARSEAAAAPQTETATPHES